MAVYRVTWVEYKSLVVEADDAETAKDIAGDHADEPVSYDESDSWSSEPCGIPEAEADFRQHPLDLKTEDPLE